MAAKASSWSIKGIEEDVRDIARVAAERSDLTIGAWIDRAIKVQGGAEPAKPVLPAARRVASPDGPTSPEMADAVALVERELDASVDRIDRAMRPVGLALVELAQRLVALERAVGPAARGEAPSVDWQAPAAAPEADEIAYEQAAEPEPPSLVVEELPALPLEPVPALAPPRHAVPPDPPFDLHPWLDPLDFPIPPSSERAAMIDRRLRALAGEVGALDLPPEPPQTDLGPGRLALEPPEIAAAAAPPRPAAPVAEQPFEFHGVQPAFESRPDLAEVEESRERKRRLARRAALAAAIAGFALVGAAGGAYWFADRIGLAAYRNALEQSARPIIDNIDRGARHILAGVKDDLAALWPARQQEPPPVPERSTAEPAAPEPSTGRSEAPTTAVRPAEIATPPSPSQTPPEPPRSAAVPEPIPAPAPTAVPAAPPPAAPGATAAAEPKSSLSAPPRPGTNVPRPAPVLPVEEKPITTPKVASLPPAAVPAAPDLPPKPATRRQPSESAADPKQTRVELETKARAGDPRAQHDLGVLLVSGKLGAPDYEAAANWFREAAIQGLPSAQYNLAVLYESGKGVRQDDVRALLWYHTAAELSYPFAQYNLGVMYAEGRGIPLNFEEAARWFRAAADQGLPRALYNLAVMTEEGLGVRMDKEAAAVLYRKAAESGDERARIRLQALAEGGKAEPTPLVGTGSFQVEPAPVEPTVVAAIQKELTRLGLYAGRIDGVVGPMTRESIEKFEAKAGLPATGTPTAPLLEKLKQTGR